MPDTRPIGIFDSGAGGISVFKEVRRLMPNEDILFYGDNKNAPYGTKSAEEVCRLSEDCLRFLLKKNCKIVIIACNTASAVAIRALREKYAPLPIVGIEPAIKPAVLENPGKRVLLLATPLTVKQERIQALAAKYFEVAYLSMKGAKGLVEEIEAGHIYDETLFAFLRGLFSDELSENTVPDVLVLGCTHYPHIKKAFRRILGEQIKLYDGGEGTARRCRFLLEKADALTDRKTPGKDVFYSSDPAKIELCRYLAAQQHE